MNTHLSAFVSNFGIGEITREGNDYIEINKFMCVCFITDKDRMLKLSKLYGIHNIHYMPYPILCHESSNDKFTGGQITITCDKSLTGDNIIYSPDASLETIFMKVSSCDLVTIIGTPRLSVLVVIFTACKPMILKNCNDAVFDNILMMSDLMILHNISKDELIQNQLEVIDMLRESNKRLRDIVMYCVSQLKVVDTSPINNIDSYPYIVAHDMDPLFTGLPTEGSGIELVISVHYRCCVKNKGILHPWVGIVDYIGELLDNNNFVISMMFCIGLITYSHCTKDTIQAKHPNIPIRIIPFKVIPLYPQFNHKAWKIDKTMVDMNDSSRVMNMKPKITSDNNSVVLIDNLDKIAVIPIELSPVSVGKTNMILTVLSPYIARCIPFVLKSNEYAVDILGINYPLFVDDTCPDKVAKLCKSINMNTVISYLKNMHYASTDELIQSVNLFV